MTMNDGSPAAITHVEVKKACRRVQRSVMCAHSLIINHYYSCHMAFFTSLQLSVNYIIVQPGHVNNVQELKLANGFSIISGHVIRQTSVTLTPWRMTLENG
ncbi:zinc finger MYM-type protein 1-like [Aphis craccivora]|uniref:Zinc finger MYM-type protein 1-like n=1 Tax=Aphis craccivora TaxID=307492 RepID=A0A6G0ZEX3_APHCR|nr:zinc finger MYM-type protein 1-like [Aphis craccivora]